MLNPDRPKQSNIHENIHKVEKERHPLHPVYKTIFQ